MPASVYIVILVGWLVGWLIIHKSKLGGMLAVVLGIVTARAFMTVSV